MSLSDPIANMLTQIRNGQMARKEIVSTPSSKTKSAILRVLEEEGYISAFQSAEQEGKPTLSIHLKYYQGKPVIDKIKRVSRPGLRVYKGKDELPKVMGGFGIAILSTSQGVITDKKARQIGQGGEVLCTVA
jgi:small subunit ribosomal protein S8